MLISSQQGEQEARAPFASLMVQFMEVGAQNILYQPIWGKPYDSGYTEGPLAPAGRASHTLSCHANEVVIKVGEQENEAAAI